MDCIAETSHFEITHGHPGKPGGWEPIISGQALLDDINSIGMELCIQKNIEEEELADGIGNVKEFADKI